MRVLLVEDNARLADLLTEGLRRSDWQADTVASLADAEAAIAEHPYDAVLLDRGLPDGDGLGLVRALRHAAAAPPVLVLTAHGAVSQVCEGLDLGADDYIVKPVAMPELVSRLNAAQRRGRRSVPPMRLGDLVYDTMTRDITLRGERFDPPPRERTLLEALLRAAPRPVAKEVLEGKLAGLNRALQPNTVEVCVHRLRNRLAAAGSTVEVHTVRGIGYCAVAGGA